MDYYKIITALTIFMIFSLYLYKYDYSKKNYYKLTILLIALTFLVYNGRNVSRLKHEIIKYNYNIINSPYFNIPDVNYVISYNKKNKKIYKPIDNMCWNIPTPCSNRSSIKMIYIKKYKAIVKKER